MGSCAKPEARNKHWASGDFWKPTKTRRLSYSDPADKMRQIEFAWSLNSDLLPNDIELKSKYYLQKDNEDEHKKALQGNVQRILPREIDPKKWTWTPEAKVDITYVSTLRGTFEADIWGVIPVTQADVSGSDSSDSSVSNPEPIGWILYIAPMLCLIMCILCVRKCCKPIQRFFSKPILRFFRHRR